MASAKNRATFDAYARAAEPDDYWRQVRRTVGGMPVDEAQLTMLVDAAVDELDLRPEDVLLDLCCGNGALTDRLFRRCAGGLGVDFSAELIAVARARFERLPKRAYVVNDVEAFLTESEGGGFTKAICNFSFQYLSTESALRCLELIRTRFSRVSLAFVSDLPDLDRLRAFFRPGDYVDGIENDHEAPLGMWRTAGTFVALANAAGWQCEIRRMPAAYHAAHYRYNALLRVLD